MYVIIMALEKLATYSAITLCVTCFSRAIVMT